MTILSASLIFFGIVISALGCWLVTVGRDPLGYSPPFTYVVALVGILVLMIGIIVRIWL
jgi:hypothetical protein